MQQNFNLTKLLSFEHIKEIFNSIKKITGLDVTLLDEEGNLLIKAKGEREYCKLNTVIDNGAHCRNSDIENIKIAREKKSIYIYKCYAGLSDAIIPLFYENKFIGAAVVGQVFINGWKKPNFKKLSNIKVNEESLKTAFNKVPVLSRQNLKDSCSLIFHILNYIIEVEIKKLIEIEGGEQGDSRKVIVEKIKNFLELNYKKNIDLNKFAKMFNVSSFYISKLFKQYVGINYKDYLMNLRIEEAKRFLSYSDISISDIAYKVGFNDSNYFSVQFKRIVGVTPKDFRKNYKNRY